MKHVLLLTENDRDRQILSFAFEQHNFKVISSIPNQTFNFKTLQCEPDLILIEIPRISTEQIQLIRLVQNTFKIKKTPIFAYGNELNAKLKKQLIQLGITVYYEKPIKFTLIMQDIKRYLQGEQAVEQDKITEKEDDVKRILDPSTPGEKKIELIVKNVLKFMAFPFTVARVLQLTEDTKSAASDLAKIIEADPVISATVIKISNTVFFASINYRISSIKDAIIRIGFNNTKRIVSTMSVLSICDMNKQGAQGFDRVSFWYHSLATAIIAERLTHNMPNLNRDEVFLTGLLHDFSVLLLDEFYPELFQRVLRAINESGIDFFKAVEKVLGISPNAALEKLFTAWKIPEHIVQAICDQASVLSGEKHGASDKGIAVCAAIANVLAKCFCLGQGCEQYVYALDKSHFAALNTPFGIGISFLDSIKQNLAMYRSILNVDDLPVQAAGKSRSLGYINFGRDPLSPVMEYFKTLGHMVAPLKKPAEAPPDYDKTFDVLCILADDEFSADQLSGFLSLQQKKSDPAAEGSPLPLLVMVPATFSSGKEVPAPHVHFVSRNGDLHLFEMLLQAVADHQQSMIPQISRLTYILAPA